MHAGCGSSSIPPNSFNFCHGCSCRKGYRILLLQENSISVNKCWVSPSQNVMNWSQLFGIKIHIDCMSVWNELRCSHVQNPTHGSRIGYETAISANYTEYRELKILRHMWRILELHFKISIPYRYFLFDCKLQPPWTRDWTFKKESCKYDGRK